MATVLLADADQERLKSLRTLVRREGHRTLLAVDGRTALDRAVRSRPAAVVSEVGLPGLDGFGLALSVREEVDADTVRVLLYRPEVSSEDETTASAVGADRIVALDDEGEVLLDALRSVLATRAPQEGALAGQADQDSLFALLQFLHQRRETGTLSVSGDRTGTLVFAGGEIIGARTRAQVGGDGFVEILRNTEGRYCFDRGLVDPSARTIERAFDPLLMDAFSALS